jgi:hypothetical protein
MRAMVITFLLLVLAGSATAESDGLSGAIDRQEQNLATQQQQFRQQLEQQQQPLTQQPPLRNCANVGGTFVCR